MKENILKHAIALISILLFSSCVEWGETLTFEIMNDTDNNILCILKNDTIKIGVNEKFINVSSEDSGNAISDPFYNYESIILIYKDSIMKEYHRDTSGKNPLNLDYYEEKSREESKTQTSITYQYLIKMSDFYQSEKQRVTTTPF